MLKDLLAGNYQRTARSMENVAAHYAISSFNFGVEVARRIAAGTLVMSAPESVPADAQGNDAQGRLIFTRDKTHPTDAGHRVYTARLALALPQFLRAGSAGGHALSAPLSNDHWQRARIVGVAETDHDGQWQPVSPFDVHVTTQAGQNLVPPTWVALEPGAKIEFRFKGTVLGLVGLKGPENGQFRVTIDDLERFLQDLERNTISPASSMRVAVADAMRRSWTRPLATVVLPVQLDTLLAHRKRQTIKAGPALYALRALALGLSEMPATAGRLIGDRLIHPRSIDIGFAVEAEDGVLVPVIRHAEQFPLADLVERYNRLVELARARRLPGSDTGGSIATITNYGVFGLTMATPIPLPEQTLLLGMGAGRITPSWDPEKKIFVPVTEAQFTLSFDHRVLDGGAAGRLLQRVAGLLGTPEEL
jgi:pyruvate/2-oxoglutarate dehydrogenase complex dihydrolipoamide acyltransferase (E2) component